MLAIIENSIISYSILAIILAILRLTESRGSQSY